MLRPAKFLGISAGALIVAIGAQEAAAQQTLPTIDVGGARAARNDEGGGRPSGARGAPTAPAAAPSTAGAPAQTVRAEDPKTYAPENASTATKTRTPIMNTPVSIQVVPQQVLRDQQAIRLDKALGNVSGVYAQPSGSAGGASADTFFIRGFKADRIYRDGFLQPQAYGGNANIPSDLADVDRVEVLKGPASILYGRIEPGGLVNLVTKQPTKDPLYSIQQQFGSFASYRTTADLGGPVGKDTNLYYRFNMAYENAGSFVDLVKSERVYVAPKLRWEIDGATQVTFFGHYLNTRDPFINGLPIFGNPPIIPSWLTRSVNLYGLLLPSGGYMNPRVASETGVLGYNFTHAFNENWTLQQKFSASFLGGNGVEHYGFYNALPDGTLPRSVAFSRGADALYQTSVDLTGNFTTAFAKHSILLGADYLNQSSTNNYPQIWQSPTIDLITRLQTGDFTRLDDSTSFNNQRREWFGIYFQDQVELPYGIHVLAGLRYDNARVKNYYWAGDPTAATIDTPHNTAVNPRFGLLWRPIPEISVYGSYVTNFGLPNGLFQAPEARRALPPTTAQQYEAGIKTELFDKRVSATFAYFNLVKQNVPTVDPFNPLLSAVTGEVRSRGVEWDLAGEILPGWRVIGSLAFTEATVTKDSVDALGLPIGNQGNRWWGVPRIGGSFWSTYEFADGDLRGLKFGAGLVSRGARYTDPANTLLIPGFTTVNAMASYEWRWLDHKIDLQLNVDNLFDRTYFLNSDGFGYVFYGAPRTFKGAMRVTF